MTVAATRLAGRAGSVKALPVIPESVQVCSRVNRRELAATGIARVRHRGGDGAAPTTILVYRWVRDAQRRRRER